MKIKLNGSYYANFEEFAYQQSLDSVGSTFSFSCRYDQEQKHLFRPLSFIRVQFYDDEDNLFFTGEVLNHGFNSNADTNLIEMSGYSLPGVIEDCNIPFSSYPLESNNMNLKEIASKFIKPFGLKLVVDSSAESAVNKNYNKTSAAPEDTIKDYLSKLAAQRNVILSHTEKGELLLFKPNTKATPVEFFNKESEIEMSLNISGQDIHSEITNLRQPKPKKTEQKKKKKSLADMTEDELGYAVNPVSSGTPAPKKVKEKPQYHSTLKNPMVLKYRPVTRTLSEGEDYSTEDAAKNCFAEELKGISVTLKINDWKNLKPGQIIEVQNDEIYLEKRTKFMIASITKNCSSEEKTMTINAVIPEAFSGEQPKNIFA